MLDRLRDRKVDPREQALTGVLNEFAGPPIIELRHKILDSEGQILPPQGLMEDADTAEVRVEYTLVYPRVERDASEATSVSIGVAQTGSGERAVYVASDGKRVLQADPREEGLIDRIRTGLLHETVRRIEEGRLPGYLIRRFSPIPIKPTE